MLRYVRLMERPDRRSKYGWQTKARPRRSKFFQTAAERDASAEAMERRLAKTGVDLLSVDLEDYRRLVEFRQRLGVEPGEYERVLEMWRRHGSSGGVGFAEALDAYLDEKKEVVAVDTFRHVEKNLRRVLDDYLPKGVLLAGVTAERFQAVLDALPFSQDTKRAHRKDLRAFYNWALRRKLVSENPVEHTRPVRVERDEVAILSVEEGKRLFRANRDEPVVGRLALEAFAGFRYSSAARFRYGQDVNFEDRGFSFPARQLKTERAKREGRRKYRGGYPDAVFAWIRHATQACWEMTERQYLTAKGDAFTRAGVQNRGNVLRHSFGTYHIAGYADPQKTSWLMLHTSWKRTDDDYNGIATAQAGKRWFAILP